MCVNRLLTQLSYNCQTHHVHTLRDMMFIESQDSVLHANLHKTNPKCEDDPTLSEADYGGHTFNIPTQDSMCNDNSASLGPPGDELQSPSATEPGPSNSGPSHISIPGPRNSQQRVVHSA